MTPAGERKKTNLKDEVTAYARNEKRFVKPNIDIMHALELLVRIFVMLIGVESVK